jgi:sialic acid synthase SpsE
MRRSLRVSLSAVLFIAACAAPPNKEMDQAQGAIDAARAAGADKFAATEYTAATRALQRAHDAVAQRDYRLALNNALESRTHAQNSAREAADARVRLRDEFQNTLADLTVQLATATARLKTTQSRMPRATARELQQSLSIVNDELQKAGAALQTEDYASMQPVLQALRGRISDLVAEIDRAGSQSARRRG